MATHNSRRTRSQSRASAPPEPQLEEEESYHQQQEQDQDLDNMSDYLIDETKGSVHESEIEQFLEEEWRGEPSTSGNRTFTQRTLDD